MSRCGVVDIRALDVGDVAEDHLGVERGARAVGAVQIPEGARRQAAQVADEFAAQEVVLAHVLAAQPLAVDERPADVRAAGVMLRQRRDEAAVLGGENRQVRRAVRRLRRLVVSLDDLRRREPLEAVPVHLQPLAETDGPRPRRTVPLKPDSTIACASPISAGTPKRS